MANIGAGVATTAYVDVDFEFSLKNVALLKPLSSRATGQYLNYSLTKQKSATIKALSNGGAKPFLSLTQIGRIRIPTPPISEQEAIAAALSDVDALLGGLDRLITKKRDLKQAAMQQLLTGQKRLPGFCGEWTMITLLDLAEGKKELFDDGDWIESEHITSQGIRFIQTGNIGVGCYVEKEVQKFIYFFQPQNGSERLVTGAGGQPTSAFHAVHLGG
jgi:type I restriction enzyme S subunit